MTPDDQGVSGGAPERPVSRSRRTLQAVGLPLWIVAGFFLSQLVFVAIVIALRSAGLSFESLNTSVLNAVAAASVYLLTVIIVIGAPWLIRRSATSLKEIGLDRLPRWQDIWLSPVAYVVYAFISSTLAFAAERLFPGFSLDQAQDVGFDNIHFQYEYVLAFLTLVVIAPVAEEVLMRGYLYGKLKKFIRVIPAMTITAITFAVMHGQWNVALDVFALSLVMTSLREVSGSIWAGILLHMIKNGIAFYFLFINPGLMNTIGGL